MSVSAQPQGIVALEKALASVESKIKILKENEEFSDEGPEFCSLEIERSRLAASLTDARNLQQQNQTA